MNVASRYSSAREDEEPMNGLARGHGATSGGDLFFRPRMKGPPAAPPRPATTTASRAHRTGPIGVVFVARMAGGGVAWVVKNGGPVVVVVGAAVGGTIPPGGTRLGCAVGGCVVCEGCGVGL